MKNYGHWFDANHDQIAKIVKWTTTVDCRSTTHAGKHRRFKSFSLHIKKENNMLIISKFHDYYDPVGKTTGIDKTIVYQRTEVELTVDFDTRIDDEGGKRYPDWRYEYKFYLIGFCGKLYPCIRHISYDAKKKKYLPIQWIFDVKKIQSIIDKRFTHWRKYARMDELVHNTEFLGLFAKYKVPAWIVGDIKDGPGSTINLVLNPNLKKMGFQTAVDPYTAFQEIMMYISGVLGTPSNPMVAVSEKTKVAKHGFDKWSFRKPPKDK